MTVFLYGVDFKVYSLLSICICIVTKSFMSGVLTLNVDLTELKVMKNPFLSTGIVLFMWGKKDLFNFRLVCG